MSIAELLPKLQALPRAEKLQLLQLLIRNPGAPFPHVDKRDPPGLLGLPRRSHLV